MKVKACASLARAALSAPAPSVVFTDSPSLALVRHCQRARATGKPWPKTELTRRADCLSAMGMPDVQASMPRHVYEYIWSVTGHRQIKLCVLTAIVIALTAAPVELQRRITDDAFGPKNLKLLALYC